MPVRPAAFAPLLRSPFVNRPLPRVLRLVRVVRADSWHASASPRSGDRRRSGFGGINAGICSPPRSQGALQKAAELAEFAEDGFNAEPAKHADAVFSFAVFAIFALNRLRVLRLLCALP